MVKDIKTLGTEINEVVRKSSLSDLMSLEKNPERKSIYVKTGLVPSEQLLEIMAVCHSLTRVNNEMIGDPLDLKMFESTQWTFEENDNQKYDSLVLAVVKSAHVQPGSFTTIENETSQPTHKEVGIVRRFEFSSKLQRMSVVVKNLNETGFKIHIKGSPEKIRELCKPESIPDSFHEILEKYTEVSVQVKI
jgi:cation-transporting ATPase 13A2